MSERIFLLCGALLSALAIALGAWSAHGLAGGLDAVELHRIDTALHYQQWQALGLFLTALAGRYGNPGHGVRWAGWLLLAGILLFCGSLWLLVMTGWPGWARLTPIGGMSLIGGWLLLGFAVATGKGA